jgi:ribosomal protein L21
MISNTAGSSVGIQPVLMVSVSDVIVQAEVVSYAGVTAIVW